MSTAARIEELRKKFEENPRRFFAPLANELRKAGDLTQAIALCREHLPKQPGHMSGYIVYGQALYESGALEESRGVFEQALALDPENLIALHHLGHIARQLGDTAAARRWYERALETDPRNDDIAHQLAALATPARPHTAVPTPTAPSLSVAAPDDASGLDLAFLDPGLLAPRKNLGAIPTPPFGQGSIDALPLAPTPDASMRAVDFDAVNVSLQQPRSGAFADIEAIEAAGEALAAGPSTPAPAVEPETLEPIDLDMDLDATSGAAVSEDPFAFAEASEPDAAAAEVEVPVVDLEAAFEEGLVHAGWAETVEIATRVATPRAVTPLSVDVTPSAAEAFGREADDRIEASLPEPEPDVFLAEADLTADAPATPVVASEETRDLTSDADPREELPWLAAPVTPTEDVTAIVHALEEDARALGEAEEVSVLSFRADEDSAEAPSASVAETSFVDVVDAAGDQTMEEAAPAPEPTAFVTETMGELLVAQGFIDRAVDVYEELVRRRPYDPVLSSRLAELRSQAQAADPVTPFTARERFARLAARQVVRRTPSRSVTPVTGTPVTEPRTPSVPAAVVTAPTPTAPIVPVTAVAAEAAAVEEAAAPTPAAPAAAITASLPAVEAAVRETAPADDAADDSLSALFGTAPATPDDYAAEALANAFAPIPLDAPALGGETSALFGTTGDAMREPTPAYGAVRQPTPSSVPTPMASLTPPPAPAVTDTAAEFSFDRFFPDPATSSLAGPGQGRVGTATPPSAPATDATTAPSTNPGEDLAQFSAWLKGLSNS